MTAKRYFKRMWEEEYYIFDSEIISENEFDEKVEYEDYQAFADSMQGDEVVNKLNQLSDENDQLKMEIEKITKAKENWAFISDCSVQVMNEEEKFKEDYLRIAINGLKKLQEENEQLKQENRRMTDKLNQLALEFLNYDMVTMGKATEISEMCYYDFLKYRKENGNPMELQL